MKVRFINRASTKIKYQDLTLHNIYQVLGIEADDYRIINDNGLPYLYSADLFTMVDSEEPKEWVTEYGEDGERYAYPPELNRVGFFEDYFDGQTETIIAFHQYLAQRGRSSVKLSSRAA
jgi:hypothetical protein